VTRRSRRRLHPQMRNVCAGNVGGTNGITRRPNEIRTRVYVPGALTKLGRYAHSLSGAI